MVNCLKSLAQKQNIAIISTIHQPNTEVIQMFDNLYVLAKEGVCVFSGRPQQLKTHLNDCGINCSSNQTPIGILLKVGSNGPLDESVIELSDKTSENMRYFEPKIARETELSPNGIPFEKKSFSIPELWYLLVRMTIHTIYHNWIQYFGQIAIYLLVAWYATDHFDFPFENAMNCVNVSKDPCAFSPKMMNDMLLEHYSLRFMHFYLTIFTMLALVLSTIIFNKEFKVFMKEYRNRMSYSVLIQLITYRSSRLVLH